MIDLKPCPFCGEKYMSIRASKIDHGFDYIRCDVCGAKVEYDHHRNDDPDLDQIIEALVEKWNRRAVR